MRVWVGRVPQPLQGRKSKDLNHKKNLIAAQSTGQKTKHRFWVSERKEADFIVRKEILHLQSPSKKRKEISPCLSARERCSY